jgi:transposase
MMGKQNNDGPKLFYVGVDIERRIPPDHPLRRVLQAVDFGFVRPLVAPLYGYNGHVSLDPVVVLKLLFLCFFENVRSERELMRQLPMRLDWMWFCGMDLENTPPDHSVLSKARKRWGEAVFERVFEQVVGLCQQAGLLEGRTVHADSTQLKAHASMEARVSRKLWEQLEAGSSETPRVHPSPTDDDEDHPEPHGGSTPEPKSETQGRGASDSSKTLTALKVNQRLVSSVDPDAAVSTRRPGNPKLGYRDHRLVDDRQGVILATVATAADRDDGAMLGELLQRQHRYTQITPQEVVGDSMYGTQENYRMLGEAKIKAYLKKRRGKDSPKVSWLELLPAGCRPRRALYLLHRRQIRAEGSFAEAHERMNHRRCRWRRRWRVQIQCYLVATVQNLKKLIQVRYQPRTAAMQNVMGFIDPVLFFIKALRALMISQI